MLQEKKLFFSIFVKNFIFFFHFKEYFKTGGRPNKINLIISNEQKKSNKLFESKQSITAVLAALVMLTGNTWVRRKRTNIFLAYIS